MAPKNKGKDKEPQESVGMSPSEKISILLNALGDEATANILKHLKDNEVRRVIMLMGKARKVSVPVLKQIMKDFFSILSEEQNIMFGADSSKEALLKGLGEERARMIFGSMANNPVQQKTLEALEMVDMRTLANFLVSEHPQTIALILAHLPSEKKTDCLKRLPEAVQGEVVLRMANLDNVSPELIQHVDDILKTELATMGTMEMTQLGGVEPVAEMFNLMDKNTEQSIMSRVEEKDPLLAEEIRRLMFVFDDIVKIDEKGMGLILKEVQNETLLKALKSAPEAVKEKVFRNMSKRAADMIRADLESAGPVRVSDVEGAQQQIVGIARRLEEEGKIVIERGGEGDGFV